MRGQPGYVGAGASSSASTSASASHAMHTELGQVGFFVPRGIMSMYSGTHATCLHVLGSRYKRNTALVCWRATTIAHHRQRRPGSSAHGTGACWRSGSVDEGMLTSHVDGSTSCSECHENVTDRLSDYYRRRVAVTTSTGQLEAPSVGKQRYYQRLFNVADEYSGGARRSCCEASRLVCCMGRRLLLTRAGRIGLGR